MTWDYQTKLVSVRQVLVPKYYDILLLRKKLASQIFQKHSFERTSRLYQNCIIVQTRPTVCNTGFMKPRVCTIIAAHSRDKNL